MSEYRGISGPWECRDNFTVISTEGQWVADVGAKPTAQLIAAAPELLEALQEVLSEFEEVLLDEFGDEPEDNKYCMKARAAIAKALGG